jgi:hypothetical protein
MVILRINTLALVVIIPPTSDYLQEEVVHKVSESHLASGFSYFFHQSLVLKVGEFPSSK